MAFLLSRRQLPVSSPTTFRSLLDGFLGATGFASTDSVSHLIKTHWSASQVVLTDSGTSALMLAIKLAAAKSDIVALPAWGCYDLATAAEGADVRVALYDLDPITLAPDYASLGRALERGARAVVIAHFYGVPVDLEEVQKIAEPYGATVVEDAAQAIGASWRGKPAGSLAPLGVLSFGRGKGLNGGGGGALLLNAASHTTSLGVQARHAGWGELVRASAQWLLARPGIYAVPAAFPFLRLGETIYHEPHPPRALARASTRMLRANWSSAHAEAATRRHNAERLNAAARASAAWQPIRVAPQAQPGYLRLPLIPSSTRDAAVMESGAKLGIMPGYPETLLSLAPFRARCINTADSFPGAEALARNLVTVPTHALLTEDDMQQIEDWLQRR